MWYEWLQNNSGGKYIVDDIRSEYVFVRSNTESEAVILFKHLIDVDWDNANSCECCGERWDTDPDIHFGEFMIDRYLNHTDDDQITLIFSKDDILKIRKRI